MLGQQLIMHGNKGWELHTNLPNMAMKWRKPLYQVEQLSMFHSPGAQNLPRQRLHLLFSSFLLS